MLEKTVEEYLVKRVKEIGGIAYKFTSPGNAGVPDRIVILPGGRIHFIELKRPKGSVTAKRQKMQQDRIKSRGADVRQVHTKEEVDAFIKEVST